MHWLHEKRKILFSMLAILLIMAGIIVFIIKVFNWKEIPKQPMQVTETVEISPAPEDQKSEESDPVIIVSEPEQQEETNKEYQNIDGAHDYNNFEKIIMEIGEYTKE